MRGTIWLLDAGVVMRAQDCDLLAPFLCAAARIPCHLAQIVVDELVGIGYEPKPKYAEAKHHIRTSLICIVDLPVEGGAYEHFVKLRGSRSTSRDAGEHQCIALATADPRYLFCTVDKKAMFEAVNEIGDRVRGLPQLLLVLRENGLSAEDSESILKAWEAKGGRRPSWWTKTLFEVALR